MASFEVVYTVFVFKDLTHRAWKKGIFTNENEWNSVTINCNKDQELVVTTRKECSSTETVTLAYEKVSYGSEIANQKWSIPIQNMNMGVKEKEGPEITRNF